MKSAYYDVDDYGILEPLDDTLAVPPISSPDPVPPSPGPVVTGNGNTTAARDITKVTRNEIAKQYAFFTDKPLDYQAIARISDRPGRGLLDNEALQRLHDNYVVPPGLLDVPADGAKSAFQILCDRRVLLLTAAGSHGGQFSAGLRLAYELRKSNDKLIVREELIESDFRFAADEMLEKNEPAVVLVDLRDSTDEIRNVRRGLVEFTNKLDKYRSYLILIVPHDQARAFAEDFPGRLHRVAKPPAMQVFEKYLVEVDARALAESSGIAEQVARMWPPDVKELADAVSNRISRGEDPEEALHKAIQDSTLDLRAEIRNKQEAGDSEWLALLLAVGMLEGATAEHIVTATDEILRHNKVKREERVPLLRPSPYSRLAHLDVPSFDLSTRELQPGGFGARVVRHFWREHPDLHESMQTWIGELPRVLRDLSSEELEQVADRSAELAAEGGYRIAITLAEHWAKTRGGSEAEDNHSPQHWANRYRRSIAVRLLTTTATDTSTGKAVRQKMLDWSKGGSADLQLLTAEVCGGIGRPYPRIAFTRLKYLADSDNEYVLGAVVDAVRQIGAELSVSRWLRYVSEWFDDATPARLRVLSTGVSAVLAEQAEQLDEEEARSFWYTALGSLPPDELRRAVESWIQVSATLPFELQAGMVEILVQATRDDAQRFMRLHYACWFSRLLPDTAVAGPLAGVLRQLHTRMDEIDPIIQQE